MDYKAWIAHITHDASLREIAEFIGTSHPTVGRHANNPNAEFTMELARHYGANPIDGLVAAGFINDDQIAEYAAAHGIGIEHFSDLDLARIIVERLEQAQESPLADVMEFPVYEDSEPEPEPEAEPFAADSSDTEPEPGEDGYGEGP